MAHKNDQPAKPTAADLRAADGLPPVVEDHAALADVATILRGHLKNSEAPRAAS